MQKAVNSYIFQNCFRKKSELKRIVALSFKRLNNDVYISKISISTHPRALVNVETVERTPTSQLRTN